MKTRAAALDAAAKETPYTIASTQSQSKSDKCNQYIKCQRLDRLHTSLAEVSRSQRIRLCPTDRSSRDLLSEISYARFHWAYLYLVL